MDSRMDMHMSTDACTHSSQGMGPEDGSLGHAQLATQGFICLCGTKQRGGAEVGSHVDMHTCTYAFTLFQGVGLEEGQLGHVQESTQGYTCKWMFLILFFIISQ